MTPNFDLITEPWIPVIRLADGGLEEVGLRDALLCAHEYRAVRDSLPTVEFGLYRLLVVLVLDIFQLEDTEMLSDLLATGRFDAPTINGYFTRWQDRFDLFSSTQPFLQTAGVNKSETESVRNLLHTMFTGQSGRHFHHDRDDFAVSPAVAARFLTTLSAFALDAGRGYSAGLNGTPPWYTVIDGGSLFTTLCLNSHVLPVAEDRGLAAWQDSREVAPVRRISTTSLEALTWRPRRVRLYPAGTGVCSISGRSVPTLVRTMTIAPGFMLSEDMKASRWLDPNVAYKTLKDVRFGICPEAGRSVWRDTAPLALLTQQLYGKDEKMTRYDRPGVISQYYELLNGGVISKDEPVRLQIYGLRAKRGQAKVFEWHRETLSLSGALVLNRAFAGRVQTEMERADKISSALRRAIKKTYKRDGKGNTKAFDDLIAYAQRQFWSSIHTAWDDLLRDIAPLTATQEAEWAAYRDKWWGELWKHGRAALAEAVNDLNTEAGALRRQVEAEKSFQEDAYRALYGSLLTGKAARGGAKQAKKPAEQQTGV